MTTLTVWKYDEPAGADRAVVTLQELVGRNEIIIQDAAVVVWERDGAKPRTRQIADLRGGGSLGEGFWGLLFGVFFFVPLLGAALGAASGALSGSLTDVGIDDTFINCVRDAVIPGTSALFLLSPGSAVDEIQDALRGLTTPDLFSCELTAEQLRALVAVFST